MATAHRLARDDPAQFHPRRLGHRHRARRGAPAPSRRARASRPRRSPRSSSSVPSPAGRSSNSRSCATTPTTASWSAGSRTSIRWACTPVTPSPSRRSRRSRTWSTRRCATTPSRSCDASASRPGDPTCSSRSTPTTGERLVIEMNPRVSRSSALASKATGFPIAKIAARLAVGYTLDEIRNDITEVTPASFEPVIDYVVTKIPRWAFEKLPGAPAELGTRMQSVGEVMAIGRNFAESLQKAVRSLEQGRAGFALGRHSEFVDFDLERLWHSCGGGDARTALRAARAALARRVDRGRRRAHRHRPLVHPPAERDHRARARTGPDVALETFDARAWRRYKQWGFSDPQIADLCARSVEDVAALRRAAGVVDDLQDRRHVRGGVRGVDAVSLQHLRGHQRGRARPRATA